MKYLPKKLNILGHEYKVEETSEVRMSREGNLLSGLYQGVEQIIFIDKGLTQSAKEETLLHEVIHAISYLLNIDLEEHKVHLISAGLYSTLKDNFKF